METLEDGKNIWQEKLVAWFWTDRHLHKIGNCQIKSELLQLKKHGINVIDIQKDPTNVKLGFV